MKIMADKKEYTTKNKTILLDYLAGNINNSVTAQDVYAYLQNNGLNVSITTIYRNLEKLVQENQLIKYPAYQGDMASYQYIGENKHCKEHLHMQCIKCGAILHLDCHFMDEFSKHIMEYHHFDMQCSESIIYGVCEKCR